jgi:hypothetical protein
MRAFTTVIVFVLSLCTVSVAFANNTVVLLGLRSIEGDDEFANQLTAAMREQARQIPTWRVSDRAVSLAQMSLAYGCEELDAACLTEIAVGLKANSIVYGTVQRTSSREDFDYTVTLNLFDADSSTIENTITETFPSSDVSPGILAVRAKRALMALAGVSTGTGSILVRTNVLSAEVLVDGESVGTTDNGSLLIEDIAAGLHEVEVVSEGYEAYRESVTVNASEQTAVAGVLTGGEADAAPLFSAGTDSTAPGTDLTWLGWTLVGVGGASLIGTVVSWAWISSIDNDETFQDYRTRVGGGYEGIPGNPEISDVCVEAENGKSYGQDPADFEDVQSMCGTADVLEVLQYVFLSTAIVSGGIGAYILIDEAGSDPDDESAGGEAPVLMSVRPVFNRSSSSVTATVRF